jgi:hypothetical protein
MRLEIRTERMQFLATRAPEPKTDPEGRQKRDQRTQEPLWQTELVALDADGAEVIRVATAFQPKVTAGQYVQVGELVASPWSMGDRSGVAYRAQAMTSVQPAAASRSTS